MFQEDPNDITTKIQLTPSRKKTFKIIALACFLTLLLIILLSILSLQTMKDQPQYSGPLSPFLPIYSGEMEYCRLPYQYWQHRIIMIKAMGMNALSIYVMWNHHQISKGVFDFTNENRNLSLFLELAAKHNMKVLLRPGPYVCAEWDFGGLPARLLGIQGMEIRSTNQLYQNQVKQYFSALAPIIRPHLHKHGGNIIMLQIQNQYGYVGNDNQHLLNLLEMWKQLDIQSQFYIEDPGSFWKVSYWKDTNIALSETAVMLRYADIELSPLRSSDSLVFGGEIYSGWFTEWGWGWGGINKDDIAFQIQKLIDNKKSFSLYLAFGGTNFGVTAGANGFSYPYDYLPHITSYDYDCPINQLGRITLKYNAILNIMERQYLPNSLPLIPLAIGIISNDIRFSPILKSYLWSNLPKTTLTNSRLTYFESEELKMYNQGIVIYQTYLPFQRKYYFEAIIRDFAIIYLDNKHITDIVRRTKAYSTFQVTCMNSSGCKLRILIEAMGHINFGKDQGKDRKGLIHFQQIGTSSEYLWNIFTIPLHNVTFENWNTNASKITFPATFTADLVLEQTGDVYFDMKNYRKGYLSVNGRLLGRYWNIGPQERLYCPGVWLKKGINQITVFELLQSKNQQIRLRPSLKDQD